ncbi:MAG: hypothetical protein ISR47_04510 [Rhodospirillales bacterium]|nr:hypothetical protein [Rhodospirillales bacterium]
MAGSVTYFPVGNADMSLVKLSDGFTILVDCYLQEEATDNRPTVADDLYEKLPEDDDDRPYVDAFLRNRPVNTVLAIFSGVACLRGGRTGYSRYRVQCFPDRRGRRTIR